MTFIFAFRNIKYSTFLANRMFICMSGSRQLSWTSIHSQHWCMHLNLKLFML